MIHDVITVTLDSGESYDILVKNLTVEDLREFSEDSIVAILNDRHNQQVGSAFVQESRKIDFDAEKVSAKLKDREPISKSQIRNAFERANLRTEKRFRILVAKYVAEGNMAELQNLLGKGK